MRLAHQTQDGIATPADAEVTPDVCSSLPSSPQSKLTESFLQLLCALGMRTTKRGKSLGEDFLSAGLLFAKETADLHEKTDGTPTRGKIT
jgi:hypothetical protein